MPDAPIRLFFVCDAEGAVAVIRDLPSNVSGEAIDVRWSLSVLAPRCDQRSERLSIHRAVMDHRACSARRETELRYQMLVGSVGDVGWQGDASPATAPTLPGADVPVLAMPVGGPDVVRIVEQVAARALDERT